MKPVGFRYRRWFADLGAFGRWHFSVRTLRHKRDGDECVPLYTADQIREAAERVRAKTLEERPYTGLLNDGMHTALDALLTELLGEGA